MKMILFLMAALVLGSACSSGKVKSSYKKDTDFSKFKTYGWILGIKVNPDDELSKHPRVLKRVENSVNKTLQEKGFKLGELENADFVVAVHGAAQTKTQVNQIAGPTTWGVYDGGYISLGYVDEGTLVIDVIDPIAKEIVWRGAGSSILKNYRDSEAEEMQQDLDEMVAKIMKSFPPQ